MTNNDWKAKEKARIEREKVATRREQQVAYASSQAQLKQVKAAQKAKDTADVKAKAAARKNAMQKKQTEAKKAKAQAKKATKKKAPKKKKNGAKAIRKARKTTKSILNIFR